ncbi:MAG: ABC transporter substrate-binding protein [Chloroflexi bacterium]|nr:ABC transporter substrate-binding protein [Chloroflexota bacterium]
MARPWLKRVGIALGLLFIIAAATMAVFRLNLDAIPLYRQPSPQAAKGQEGCTAKIGIVHPLTSASLKAAGTEVLSAYELARDEINAGGVGGCQLQLVIEDDGGIAEKSRAATRVLIDDEKVPVVVSTLLSDGTLAMSLEANKRATPLLVHVSGSPLITGSGFEWVFRVTADQVAEVSASLDFLASISETLPLPSLAVIYANDFTSMGRATILTTEAAARGYRLVAYEAIESGSSDFSADIARVRQASPDVLFLATTSLDDAVLIVRQIGKSGWSPMAMIGLGGAFTIPDFVKSGSQTEYFLGVMSWASDASWRDETGRSSRDFIRNYEERFGTPPGNLGVLAYMTLKLAASALDKALATPGDDLRAKVRRALRQIDGQNSLIGPIKFDRRGQNQRRPLVVQVIGEEYVTVYTEGAGARLAIVPVPPFHER